MSQITIGGTTLNFKDSAFTGDQWEQVASWVLNGGAEGIDANAQIATKKAAAASASAAAARNSATSAGESAAAAASSATAAANSATAAKASEDAAANSATNASASATNAGKSASNAANSASAASSKADDAIAAASDAQDAKNKAADSQVAAKLSEDNAAASETSAGKSATAAASSATAAAESIKHAPRINSSGKWELWDATKNAYVATEYTAIGEDGIKWWTYAYPIGITEALEVFMDKSKLLDAAIGDYVLQTMSNAGIVFEITGETEGGRLWVVKEKCTLRGKDGTDGTTPHIGENGNWYVGNMDTGVKAASVYYVDISGTNDDITGSKTFAEIKAAYEANNVVVARQNIAIYELTYISDTRVEFTRVDATSYTVWACSNSGAPSEADVWQFSNTKRVNYDTEYRDIGLKTVPGAIKELQDKSLPAVTDADAGKYLHVNPSTKELEWAEAVSGGSDLPTVTAADAGKFLRVSSSGSWVAETVANANGGEF